MSQTQRVSGRATAVFTDDAGWTNVIYHETAVVKFNDKEVILNSGGWNTATTKTRMNQTANQFNLGYCVVQHNGVWTVHTSTDVLPFFDGMIITRSRS